MLSNFLLESSAIMSRFDFIWYIVALMGVTASIILFIKRVSLRELVKLKKPPPPIVFSRNLNFSGD